MPGERKKDKRDKTATPEVMAGVFMFPNGDKYDGEYIQLDSGGIERSGTGSHVTADGTCYNGTWHGDKMNGKGDIKFPSGACYEGDFIDNQFHGCGKYTFPNGSFYEGQFVENKLEGEGEFTDTDTQQWVGQFRFKAALGLRFKLNL